MGTSATFRGQALRACILPPLLLGILSAIFLGLVVHLLAVLDEAGRSSRLFACAHAVSRSLIDRELAYQGYRAARAPAVLRDYHRANFVLPGYFAETGRLLADDPRQSSRLAKLRARSESWGRDAARELDGPGPSPKAGGGPKVAAATSTPTDEIRSLLDEFLDGERAGIDRRSDAAHSLSWGVLAGFSAATIPLAGLLAYRSHKQMIRLVQTRDCAIEDLQAKLDQRELENLGLLSESMQYYAIFKLDPEGKVTTWNTECEHILGYQADDIVGRRTACFYGDAALKMDLVYQDMEWATLEGRVEEDRSLVRKDGFPFKARVTLVADRDANGSLKGFTNVVHLNGFADAVPEIRA